MENDGSYISEMQQVRRINGASQSLQKLWFLQQERNHSTGLMIARKHLFYLKNRKDAFFCGQNAQKHPCHNL